MKHTSDNLKHIIAILVTIIAMVLPALADGNTLDVKCVDQAGSPAAGVKVTIFNLSAQKTKDKKSDNAGMASFTKLDDGIYRIVGRKDGFAPAFYEYIQLQNASQQSETLKFEPGSPDTKLYFEDPAVGQRSIELLQQAAKEFQEGKMPEGEKLLRESLQIYPSNPDALFYLGILDVQLKKWDEAEQSLKQCLGMTSMIAQLQKDQGQTSGASYEQVAQRAEQLLKLVPSYRLRSEADKLASGGKYEDAIVKYKQALDIDAADPDLLYNMGLAQGKSGHYDEALQSAEKAIQLKPAEPQYQDLKKRILDLKQNEVLLKAKSILEEGDKLYKSADYAGAVKKYEEALPMIPENKQGGIYLQIGRGYAQLKQVDQAVAAFKKAIEIAPDQGDYRKALAQYYLSNKQYDEALNVYSDPRTTGKVPPDQALFTLGQALSNQGNSDVAELAFEKALKLNPDNLDAMYELGMLLYYSKKDDAKAKELLTKYVQLGKDKAKLDNASTVLVVLKRRSP
jgi:tetratricopeptide (TPR) repeat protein